MMSDTYKFYTEINPAGQWPEAPTVLSLSMLARNHFLMSFCLARS